LTSRRTLSAQLPESCFARTLVRRSEATHDAYVCGGAQQSHCAATAVSMLATADASVA
jgi:hypothetical protein